LVLVGARFLCRKEKKQRGKREKVGLVRRYKLEMVDNNTLALFFLSLLAGDV
jgi:hypothetical protein